MQDGPKIKWGRIIFPATKIITRVLLITGAEAKRTRWAGFVGPVIVYFICKSLFSYSMTRQENTMLPSFQPQSVAQKLHFHAQQKPPIPIIHQRTELPMGTKVLNACSFQCFIIANYS